MSLTNEQKKRYRSLGHSLKPIVTVAGKGLTESVINEINRALNDHELVKVKLAITDRESRKRATEDICKQTNASIIQEIGKVILIFREAKKPKGRLSNLQR